MRTIHSHPMPHDRLDILTCTVGSPIITGLIRTSVPSRPEVPAVPGRVNRIPSNRFVRNSPGAIAGRMIFEISLAGGPVSKSVLVHYETIAEMVTVVSTADPCEVCDGPAASAGGTTAPEEPIGSSAQENRDHRRGHQKHRADRPPDRDGEISLEQLRQTQDYLRSLSARSTPLGPSRQGWDRFYAQYDPLVRRTVEAWRMPRADAEDCIQEIWTEIVGKLSKLDFDPRRGRFRSWLYTLIRRKMIRQLRRRPKETVRGTTDPTTLDAGPDADPSVACVRRENRELLHRTLAELRRRVSEKNYRVVHLRWIDGRGAAEIADEVDLTQEQVRYRLRRMKRKLRNLLAKQDNHGRE